jgi:16S rRNA (adenine1518-N6/adenine1519-N6)-dimethyltransferase
MKKSYGQHFLHDKNIIAKIVDAVLVEPGELLIEVGPGAGALTEGLSELTHGGLTLIEADRDLVPSLRDRFPQAEIVQADAAMVDYDAITQGRPWVFVSNLPYNAGNAILEKIFTSKNPPRQLVVMVQKEVGERMMANAGEMSVLSVATQLYCDVERLCIVKPGAFIPPPKVDSMVLRLTTKAGGGEREEIIALAKIGFAHRRKQLRQTLAQASAADLAAIDAAIESIGRSKTVRPQELSAQDWVKLFSILNPS